MYRGISVAVEAKEKGSESGQGGEQDLQLNCLLTGFRRKGWCKRKVSKISRTATKD